MKTIQHAELVLLKKAGNGNGGNGPFDPKKPRAVRMYVANAFPMWQDACMQIVRESYGEEHDEADDARVRQLLI